MFILTDIHTHDLVYLNVYLLTISTFNILVNTTDSCFLGWYWISLDHPDSSSPEQLQKSSSMSFITCL